ncbi:hypothetical protein [Gilliamella mensalis]|uniref:hypothetical protein n=1 Tax=Gilliamella mensalis TaxID=1908520 RepID=UPI000A15EB07|nr:hypothetical protein [Gilliamella mensalis]
MKKIDWFIVISDLQRNKISMSRLATDLKVSERTIANWKSVNEPKYSAGIKIIELWRKTMNRTEIPCIKEGRYD